MEQEGRYATSRSGGWLTRRETLKAGGLGLAVLMTPSTLAACGEGSTTSPNTIKLLYSIQDVFGLDPRTSSSWQSLYFVKRNVFDTIVRVDPRSGKAKPLLAASLPVQENETSWVVRLRPGVRFHDGTPLTAADVKYTVDSTNDPKAAALMATVFSFIAGTEIVNDHTVRFRLARPSGSFVDRMGTLAVLPARTAKRLGKEFAKRPVGTGPYKFVRAIPNGPITLERYEKYALGPKGNVTTVVEDVVANGQSRVAELRTGQADIALGIPPQLFENLTDPIVADRVLGSTYEALELNVGKKPFSDSRVRQAIAHAINRDEIIQGAYKGYGKRAIGPLPPWHWAYNPAGFAYDHDPEKAKALLRQAGYPDGISFEMLAGDTGDRQTIATLLKRQLEEAGFKVAIKSGQYESLFESVFNKTFDTMSITGDTGVFGYDPDIFYRWLYYSGTFTGATKAQLADLQTAIDKADSIPADERPARQKAYWALQDYVVRQAHTIHIMAVENLDAWRSEVTGYRPRIDNSPVLSEIQEG